MTGMAQVTLTYADGKQVIVLIDDENVLEFLIAIKTGEFRAGIRKEDSIISNNEIDDYIDDRLMPEHIKQEAILNAQFNKITKGLLEHKTVADGQIGHNYD